MAMISSQGAPANDQLESATFVIDSGRRLGVKISSSHSPSELDFPLCQALGQRQESLEFGPGMTPEG